MKGTVLALALMMALLFSALVTFRVNLASTNFVSYPQEPDKDPPTLTVQASKSVSGIISSDTIWTKTNSPYTLTGTVSIGSGVTLTIEPGVTVNLNSYDIQVDGTLTARGSYTDKIIFNGGNIDPNKAAITFMPGSTNWNEQTSSGCIVENANLLNARAIHISDVIG